MHTLRIILPHAVNSMSSSYIKDLQSGLSAKDRLHQIVEHGMCIGCGLCESVAGVDSISLQLVDNGTERPIASDRISHNDVDQLLQYCTGTRLHGLPSKLVDESTNNDAVWGYWQDIYFTHSAEHYVRHISSTGGALTGIALYLLESNSVDFIVHAQASVDNPAFGEACISRSREDVLKAAGSRYGPTATLRNIIDTLELAVQNEEKFAFIGTPCDVSALRNYAELDPRVDQYCYAMLTMVCGGFMAPAGLKDFLALQGIELDQVTSLRYRGYGCPGPTTIETADGKSHQFTYLDFWGEDDSAWQLPPRCKVCADGIGDAADIAVSDTWDGGSPTVEQQKSDLGTNAAVVRTKVGQEIMAGAIGSAYLVRGTDLNPTDMNRFQPHQEAKKRAVWARFRGMQDAGNITPDTQELRIEKLYLENSDEENLSQREGTRQRVVTGKFSEPTPRAIIQTKTS